MTQQTHDANSILMGGGGPPAWKFDDPGTTHQGTVAAQPVPRQERDYDPLKPGGGNLKVWPDGQPIMGVTVEIQGTERNDPSDDGRRTFYIEGRYLKEAVREAVREAGCSGLEVGGALRVTFTHRADPMDKRSRKYWTVVYTPAGNAALMAEDTPAPTSESFLQGGPLPSRRPVEPGQEQFNMPAATAAAIGMTPEQAAAFTAWQKSQLTS